MFNKIFKGLVRLLDIEKDDKETSFKNNQPKRSASFQRSYSDNFPIAKPSFELEQLIAQLSYIGEGVEKQRSKRQAAYQKLTEMKSEAAPAIPELIKKLFIGKTEEQQMARDTLNSIDANWPAHQYTQQEIPFLIKQLEKKQLRANKAIRILRKSGKPAFEALIEILEFDVSRDAYFKSNALKILETEQPSNPKLLPILHGIFQNSNNIALLETALDALRKTQLQDEHTTPILVRLIDNQSYIVRAKAILAAHILKINPDFTVLPLLRALADNFSEVRDNAITALSAIEHPIADEFYKKAVTAKGKLSNDELKGVFNKIEFLINSDIEDFRINARKYWDNLSWYQLELEEDLKKARNLLAAVLQILENKEISNGDLLPVLKEICEETEHENLRVGSIRVLSNMKEQKEELLPLLLAYLNNKAGKVRKASIAALTKLDENWLERKESMETLDQIITQLDGYHEKISSQAIVDIGAPIIPLLNQKLAVAQSRVMQQTIIKILDGMGESAKISLPTLLNLKERCSNLHTLEAIKELVAKLEKEKSE